MGATAIRTSTAILHSDRDIEILAGHTALHIDQA
jgi:hypothetical protein